MIEKKTPSGAKLEITLAPFADAKTLFKACAKEMKGLKINSQDEIDVNLFKDIFCTGLASDEIEEALWPCLQRCLYKGHKITRDSFEDENGRQDFYMVCFEVAKANIDPFLKSLYAEFSHLMEKAQGVLA